MIASLARLSAADARRHPGQTLLALAGLAVGVAVFTSVQAAQTALGASLDSGLQRLSGEADLQITGIGGVGELQEALRAVPAVAATGAVIEQVVDVDDRRHGSLLVVAGDLAGDPRVSNYRLGEEGETDTLVFIAQPDSIAITREFAARAGLKQGDAFTVHIGSATRRLVVRGLMSPRGFAGTFRGNVALMDVFAAQQMFERGRAFDRIDVMVAPDVTIEDARAQIARAIGPAYQVNTTERRRAELQRRTDMVVGGFDFIAATALALGIVLSCQVYFVALQRRRRSIGILRALGATPRQITAMFLIEAVIIGAVGGLAGGLLGQAIAANSLQFVGATLDATRGPDGSNSPLPGLSVVTAGVLVGWLAALLAVALPARAAARLRPVDAISTGVFVVAGLRSIVPAWLLASLGLAAASIVASGRLASARFVVPVCVLVVAAAAMILGSRLACRLLASAGRRLASVFPGIGAIAGDSLQAPRRTKMTAAVLIASATFALGLTSHMLAVRASFDGWIANVMTADLYVRGSGGWGPSRMHLHESLGGAIAGAPGVAAVDATRHESIDFRGQAVTLMAVESAGYVRRVSHTYLAGGDAAFADIPSGRACIVTDTFSKTTGLGSGDVVAFDTPVGRLEVRIAAIVAGDRRTVIIERSVFVRYWRADRVDAFAVTLVPGADISAVERAIRDRIGPDSPALVTTREAFADEMRRVLGVAFAMMQGIVVVALVIAVLGVALSQLAIASERARDIGILKAIGASPNQIRAAALLESATLTVVALLLAIPLGELMGWVLRERISVRVSGFEFDRVFPWTMVAMLSLALPVLGAIASWLPAWRLAAKRVAAALAHE